MVICVEMMIESDGDNDFTIVVEVMMANNNVHYKRSHSDALMLM